MSDPGARTEAHTDPSDERACTNPTRHTRSAGQSTHAPTHATHAPEHTRFPPPLVGGTGACGSASPTTQLDRHRCEGALAVPAQGEEPT
jgi:hypothetical protein